VRGLYRTFPGMVSLVLHYLELTRITIFSSSLLVLCWCLKKEVRVHWLSLFWRVPNAASVTLRTSFFVSSLSLSLSSSIPNPVAYPTKTTSPTSRLVHAIKAAVKWPRTARRQRCSVQARPHLTDFLASFWNSPIDLCVSHVCWHCVACIALPQADANIFFHHLLGRLLGLGEESFALCARRQPS
jgi:hypothetical protein